MFKTHTIKRPAFFGLNTIDALADSDGAYATDLVNMVFNREGRLAVKQPWRKVSTGSGTTSEDQSSSLSGYSALLVLKKEMPWGKWTPINQEPQYYSFPGDTGVNGSYTDLLGYSTHVDNGTNLGLRVSLANEAHRTNERLTSACEADATTSNGYTQARYVSGMMSTEDYHTADQGTWTVRGKMPLGKGLWGGIWLMGRRASDGFGPPPEYDFEFDGNRPNEVYLNVHHPHPTSYSYQWNTDTDSGTPGGIRPEGYGWYTLPGGASINEFNDYTFVIDGEYVKWYVNGTFLAQAQRVAETGDTRDNLYMIMNLAVMEADNCGHAPGFISNLDGTTTLPAEFQIESWNYSGERQSTKYIFPYAQKDSSGDFNNMFATVASDNTVAGAINSILGAPSFVENVGSITNIDTGETEWASCTNPRVGGGIIMFQRKAIPRVSPLTSDLMSISDITIGANPPPAAGVCHTAFGHVFAADAGVNTALGSVNDSAKILYWSDYRDAESWTTQQDLTPLFTHPGDGIVAIRDHNGMLIVLCRYSVLIFDFRIIDLGSLTPAFSAAELVDRIDGVGCIHQGSVQNTGSDLVWLGFGGVHSLGRAMQDRNNPLGNVSQLIAPDLQDIIRSVKSEESYGGQFSTLNTLVSSAWWSDYRWYLLSFPEAGGDTYVFDYSVMTEIGTPRIFKWKAGTLGITCFFDESSSGFASAISGLRDEPLMHGAVLAQSGRNVVCRYSEVSYGKETVAEEVAVTPYWVTPFMDLGLDSVTKAIKQVSIAARTVDELDSQAAVEVYTDYNDVDVQYTTEYTIAKSNHIVNHRLDLGGDGSLIALKMLFTMADTRAVEDSNQTAKLLEVQRVTLGYKPGGISMGV